MPRGTQKKAVAREPLEILRGFYLAGLGAAALAVDESRSLYGRFVERGENAEKEIEGQIEEIKDRVENLIRDARTKVKERIEKGLDAIGFGAQKSSAKAKA